MRQSRDQTAKARRSAALQVAHPWSANQFDPQDVVELQNSLVGSVVTAVAPDYDRSRFGFLRNAESLPQIICYCEVVRDVVRALEFARRHDLAVVCRSGGHSTACYSVNDEMVIDVGRMNHVVVDEMQQTARVGPGTNFQKLESVLEPYGLHVPGGGCPSVAVAGYMQGGGYSFTSQIFGMNCDLVVACDVVTADGELLHVDETHHQDLFWALRGGTGNNFGVLVEMTYRLHQLRELRGFGLRWSLDTESEQRDAAEALAVWQDHYTGADAAPDMGTEVMIVDVARGDAAPNKELLIRGVHLGNEAECAAALEPLIARCPDGGSHDLWFSGTYEEVNRRLMTEPTDLPAVPLNVRASVESRIVAEPLSVADWSGLIDLYTSIERGAVMIAMESYGGAINAVSPDDTAFVHRRAMMNVFIWSFWMHADEQLHAERHVDEFRELMHPLSNGHAYQNYPNRSTPPDVYPQLYWGASYPRLQAVKQRYDPDERFRFPQMVRLPEAVSES